MSRGPLESINRYPDMRGRVVCQRLAAQYEEDQLARTGTGLGLTEDNFLLGAGSTEVITQLVRMVAGPGDQVIYPWRSFEAYPIMVSSAGAPARAGRSAAPSICECKNFRHSSSISAS